MNLEEYRTYSMIATSLFNYMNGRINTMNNNCTLYIDMWDNITNTYANIRYPNHISLHVGSVIDSWDDNWKYILNKHDYICTCIAWAISHELHHADQLISMLRYNSNPQYRSQIEEDVERASYDWVLSHKQELSVIGGFNVIIDRLSSSDLPLVGNYRKATPKEFYLQTIANTIIRDMDLFVKLKVFSDDNMSDDIILVFNDIDTIVIKSSGKYLMENIPLFSNIVFKWVGYCDVYNIYADVSFSYMTNGRTAAIVKFNISNQFIKPMVFMEK
jgi:hypothetical protein